MSTLPNAPYHHGNLRQALLEAALLILERDGEASLGLRDLARAVGVSPAAPYRHFDSRAALLEVLAITGFQRLASAMETLDASDRFDRLPELGHIYLRFAQENQNLFHLMFSPQLRKDNRPGLRMAAERAFQTMRHLGGADRLRMLTAWAKLHGLATLLLAAPIAPSSTEESQALVAAIVDGL